MSMMLNGVRIIESLWLTEPGDPVEVRRTWRERLFSRPWRPFVRTRTVIPQVPMRGGYRLGGDLLMHPAMVQELKRELDRQSAETGRKLPLCHPMATDRPTTPPEPKG